MHKKRLSSENTKRYVELNKLKETISKMKKQLVSGIAIVTALAMLGTTIAWTDVKAEENDTRNMYLKATTSEKENTYVEMSGADLVRTASDTNIGSEDVTTNKSEETSNDGEKPITEKSTTEEPTTEEQSTEKPTTEEPTTEKPTTESPTTKPTTPEVVKPWGKNSKGQFVNGVGQVIVGATMKGVDVSHHQGVIDWEKVSESDVDFAIIRCGYGNDQKDQDDRFWERNVTECEKYNIPFGVYIYSYATTTKMAKSEANHVLRLIKGHKLNFPIYFDMEDACQAQLTSSQRKSIAETFINAIKVQGYECGIYANLNWWNNYLPDSLVQTTTWKWVAQYNPNACTYQGSYQMWQSSSTARVSGIYGDVDINFWFAPVRNRSYNIQKITAPPTTTAKPTTKPVTAPKQVTIKSVKAGKKKATLKWKKVSGAKGYQIQYSTKKSFKKKYTKTKNTTKTSIIIKKLKKKKTYYFRVKAYKKDAKGKKVYSKKWSKVKSKKIK